jgi:hypothetical protein
MVTGDVLFEDAGLCRQVEAKCGKEAKHFEPKPNKLGFFGRLLKNVYSR